MDILWSPWRFQYIKSASKPSGCVFCEILKNNDDERSFIVYRGKYSFIILNLYPYNTGHLMIVPFRHVPSYEILNTGELREMSYLTQAVLSLLRDIYGPEGFNVGMNIGREAGAGVDSHIHIHVVPRWKGDSNFMQVIGGTKVMPETLDTTFSKIKSKITHYVEKYVGNDDTLDQ